MTTLQTHRTARAIPAGQASASHLLARLLHTDPDDAVLVLRVSLGLILFPHGAQHLVGWFGGYGFSGTHQWMTGTLGFPAALATVAIVVEFFGSIALVLGVGSRIAAAGMIGLMVGAAGTHLQHGFFMNWFGTLAPGAEGFEYHLLVIAIAVAIVIRGGGALSIDRALMNRRVPDRP